MSTGLVDTAVRLHKERGGKITRGHTCLLRSINGDFTSSRGFRWPFPGGEAVADGVVKSHTGPCPSVPGDGLCLGKTWAGIASGGVPASTLLLCSFSKSAVLGEDAEKVRVSRARVLDVFTFAALVAEATDDERAYLGGADLGGADLGGADLRGADLGGAYLGGADLRGADLRGADLRGAYLGGADLGGADLGGADLRGADLPSTLTSAEAKARGADL